MSIPLEAVCVLALALLAVPARAEDMPHQLAPDLVQTEHEMCETSTGYGRDFTRFMDVDGDGRRDVVLDYSQTLCGGVPEPYCNADGCLLKVWIATPKGYRKAFDGRVKHWGTTTVGGRPTFVIDGRPLGS